MHTKFHTSYPSIMIQKMIFAWNLNIVWRVSFVKFNFRFLRWFQSDKCQSYLLHLPIINWRNSYLKVKLLSLELFTSKFIDRKLNRWYCYISRCQEEKRRSMISPKLKENKLYGLWVNSLNFYSSDSICKINRILEYK